MKAASVLLVCAAVWGCGGKHQPVTAPALPGAAASQSTPLPFVAPGESLEAYMARMRAVSAQARPAPAVPASLTIEASDAGLGAALAKAALTPSPASYRAVAAEYRRLNVFDRAHQYLARAVALDHTDAANYDALARLWRDSGFPQLGLAEAYRAVYYAPRSAVARNTLGTVLQALGQRSLAHDEYVKALEIDPSAAYALNNLCYGYTLEGETSKAIAACEQALKLQPDLTAARNNLGLAHAAAGDGAAARAAFASAGDRATALYNTGIVHLAQRQFGNAVAAFQAAHALRPEMKNALARVNQAKAAAAAVGEE
ncbi:MAG TPA: hypothetical protein VFV95_16025 [Vicinamibacterales bacterium]|nr:hypothetical protein [Vicinamibacterales bacterium]